MPHPTNKFDAETLPDPELNPLLNPLLAAHMGRWAEVYFTSPPEKRSQAVSELLRELENASPSEGGPIRVTNDESRQEETEIEARQPPQPSLAAAPVCTCNACAHDNPVGQKFCGMCGAPLQFSQLVNLPQYAETPPSSEASWREPEPPAGVNSVEHEGEPIVVSTVAAGSHDALEPAWLPERDFSQFDVAPEPLTYRYRIYVGAVLAILLAVLVYMAWRGTAALSGGAQSAPSRAVPATPPAPAAPPQRANGGPNALPATAPPATPIHIQTKPAARSGDESADAASPPPVVPVATGSSVVAAGQSGAEELATAQKYLSGNSGASGDSSEAAQWLWKAVAKGNVAATIALSDLYLRGDGVPKNCDQARLLLDAAARKGGRAAAERLRNLRAFGCQ